MLPEFITAETVVDANGTSEAIDLGDAAGRMLLLTLGITDIVEQESLDVLIWGSADGEEWGEDPLRVFPQKFYSGKTRDGASTTLVCNYNLPTVLVKARFVNDVLKSFETTPR